MYMTQAGDMFCRRLFYLSGGSVLRFFLYRVVVLCLLLHEYAGSPPHLSIPQTCLVGRDV